MLAHTIRPILVLGNVTTADNLADVTAFASDVADRLRFPAVVATHRDYDLSKFEGVVLADGWSESFPSAALGCEALTTDMCTMEARDVYEYAVNTTCGHCGEVDPEAAPVYRDGMWTVSVCPGCVSAHESLRFPGIVLPVAA
ncbi:hypothetical protein [Streptomyces fuscichromogenes]|uniref:Uncharacterized protein n=1 Tax=Streptomyces fuscichromogenes TaxID=1324013 RepID=A0A917XLB4_9ACTN|nr:hypothetical protein [Streptomyces fuscichromogenes]GGN38168.1 hypothetical protein GCM10011578_083280 [Streptomyces fuscichromogenes]